MPFAIPPAWLLRVLYKPHVTPTGRIEYKEAGVAWKKFYYIPQPIVDMYQGQDRQTTLLIQDKAARLGFLSNVPPVRTPLTAARDALAAYAVALALEEDSSPVPALANGPRAPRFVSAPANLAAVAADLGVEEPSTEGPTVGKDRKRRMSGEEGGRKRARLE